MVTYKTYQDTPSNTILHNVYERWRMLMIQQKTLSSFLVLLCNFPLYLFSIYYLLQSAKLASLITFKLVHHKVQNVRSVRWSSTKLGLWEVWDSTKLYRTLCSNLYQVFMRRKWKEEGHFMNKVSYTLCTEDTTIYLLWFNSEVTFYMHVTYVCLCVSCRETVWWEISFWPKDKLICCG